MYKMRIVCRCVASIRTNVMRVVTCTFIDTYHHIHTKVFTIDRVAQLRYMRGLNPPSEQVFPVYSGEPGVALDSSDTGGHIVT